MEVVRTTAEGTITLKTKQVKAFGTACGLATGQEPIMSATIISTLPVLWIVSSRS